MEGLKTRTFVVAGVMVALAVIINAIPRPDLGNKTEDQMEDMLPVAVMGSNFLPNRQGDSEQSYKMDDVTYETLKPFGIVCRTYDIDGDLMDAVVIASRSKDSFHDPRVCFSAQNWEIERFDPITVQTKERGPLPATLIGMRSTDRGERTLALFMYRGPGGFYGSTQMLKLAFLREQLMLGNNLDGVFYRFIPTFQDKGLEYEVKERRLLRFVGNFMDEAYRTSGGYF